MENVRISDEDESIREAQEEQLKKEDGTFTRHLKCVKHISFYFFQNSPKIILMNNIINNCNNYEILTDIFIHTQVETECIKRSLFSSISLYTNGNIEIIKHSYQHLKNP